MYHDATDRYIGRWSAYLCQPSQYPREARALDDATAYSTRSVPETGVALIAACLIYQVRKSQLKQRR